MMKILFFFILIAILALLQSSFFIHFSVYGVVLNFLLLLTVVFNLLEDPRERDGIYIALFSGLWFDVFSTLPFGIYVASFLALSFILKMILRKYVGIPVS